MKNNIIFETYILPAHWACPLVNNDYSGVNEQDEQEIDKFIKSASVDGHLFYCVAAKVEDAYFSHHNDAHTLACDVCEFTFDVSKY